MNEGGQADGCTGTDASERLADNRSVSLCLRLLVDLHRQIISGEVGALSADEQSHKWVRFRGSAGVLEAVQAWLAELPDTRKSNS
jgi:hypothetical protein